MILLRGESQGSKSDLPFRQTLTPLTPHNIHFPKAPECPRVPLRSVWPDPLSTSSRLPSHEDGDRWFSAASTKPTEALHWVEAPPSLWGNQNKNLQADWNPTWQPWGLRRASLLPSISVTARVNSSHGIQSLLIKPVQGAFSLMRHIARFQKINFTGSHIKPWGM